MLTAVERIELSDKDYRALRRLVLASSGLDLGRYKDQYIRRRVTTRMRRSRVSSSGAYLDLISRDREEMERLLAVLTVNTTRFFRNREMFEALEGEIFTRLVARRKEAGPLRCLSVGCSSGEEPYSLALLFLDRHRRVASRPGVEIKAVDVDADAVAEAREGVFSGKRLEEMNAELADRYFRKTRDGRWRLAEEVKKLVSFEVRDVLGGRTQWMGKAAWDLVMCRNVLIYLERDRQRELLSGLRRALKENGLLVIGKAEVLPAAEKKAYESLNLREKIYRKREAGELSERDGKGGL